MKSSNEHRQSSFKGKGEKSPLAICCTFLAQPSINPETGKPLVYNSSFYQTLIKQCEEHDLSKSSELISWEFFHNQKIDPVTGLNINPFDERYKELQNEYNENCFLFNLSSGEHRRCSLPDEQSLSNKEHLQGSSKIPIKSENDLLSIDLLNYDQSPPYDNYYYRTKTDNDLFSKNFNDYYSTKTNKYLYGEGSSKTNDIYYNLEEEDNDIINMYSDKNISTVDDTFSSINLNDFNYHNEGSSSKSFPSKNYNLGGEDRDTLISFSENIYNHVKPMVHTYNYETERNKKIRDYMYEELDYWLCLSTDRKIKRTMILPFDWDVSEPLTDIVIELEDESFTIDEVKMAFNFINIHPHSGQMEIYFNNDVITVYRKKSLRHCVTFYDMLVTCDNYFDTLIVRPKKFFLGLELLGYKTKEVYTQMTCWNLILEEY